MSKRIERDANRFREIVRGRIRGNLRKYVTHGEMIGRKGKDLVSIPIPSLDVPRFRYGDNRNGGVGQGDGKEGGGYQARYLGAGADLQVAPVPSPRRRTDEWCCNGPRPLGR